MSEQEEFNFLIVSCMLGRKADLGLPFLSLLQFQAVHPADYSVAIEKIRRLPIDLHLDGVRRYLLFMIYDA